MVGGGCKNGGVGCWLPVLVFMLVSNLLTPLFGLKRGVWGMVFLVLLEVTHLGLLPLFHYRSGELCFVCLKALGL